MTIEEFKVFLAYYSKVRKRTLRVIQCIPPDKIEWTYQEGKFTFGDFIRHLAATERYLYAEAAQFKPSAYRGCGPELASGFDNILAYLNKLHEESMAIFSALAEEDLNKKCRIPGDVEITLWKWLRLMPEHEIHHRGQMYTYLGMLNIPTPPIYGLTEQELAERSTKM